MDDHGLKLINVVERAHLSPFTFKSDFARYNAEYVAWAASFGFISAISPDRRRLYKCWTATEKGLSLLRGVTDGLRDAEKLKRIE